MIMYVNHDHTRELQCLCTFAMGDLRRLALRMDNLDYTCINITVSECSPYRCVYLTGSSGRGMYMS